MPRRNAANQSLSLLGTLALLALPKCPLCFIGLASLLGVLGISTSAYMERLPLFTGLCLGLAVVTFALPPQNRRLFSPLWLGSVAAGAIWLGKFQLTNTALFYGGLVLFLCAGLWNVWRTRNPNKRTTGCCTTTAAPANPAHLSSVRSS